MNNKNKSQKDDEAVEEAIYDNIAFSNLDNVSGEMDSSFENLYLSLNLEELKDNIKKDKKTNKK
ncbi:MAG: hypothetical protein ACRCYC_09945 [Paraclostridium sp.]|uniref:hypothetical protein n=1 Tax=Paraclostridium sp. TaxID=2023273 RepID=UPI003F2E4C25